MKPKHQRLIFVAGGVVFLCLAVIFTLRAFKENMVYFYSPSDIVSLSPNSSKLIRIGGLVKDGSISHGEGNRVHFTVTDNTSDVDVDYQGVLPGLFRPGQGVVAEGYLVAPGNFTATTVLTKHDEKYMPPDVVNALKKSGRWREGKP